MSGGSMNYLYLKVREVCDPDISSDLIQVEGPDVKSPILRKAFRDHLLLVADALKAIEWVDSSDSGPGDEDDAIRAVFRHGREWDVLL